MNKTKVISNKNFPVPMPLQFSAIVYLLLDKFHADSWVWGVVCTILAIFWIAYFVCIATSDYVDIFEKRI